MQQHLLRFVKYCSSYVYEYFESFSIFIFILRIFNISNSFLFLIGIRYTESSYRTYCSRCGQPEEWAYTTRVSPPHACHRSADEFGRRSLRAVAELQTKHGGGRLPLSCGSAEPVGSRSRSPRPGDRRTRASQRQYVSRRSGRLLSGRLLPVRSHPSSVRIAALSRPSVRQFRVPIVSRDRVPPKRVCIRPWMLGLPVEQKSRDRESNAGNLLDKCTLS